jgi:hypothetical protein
MGDASAVRWLVANVGDAPAAVQLEGRSEPLGPIWARRGTTKKAAVSNGDEVRSAGHPGWFLGPGWPVLSTGAGTWRYGRQRPGLAGMKLVLLVAPLADV